MRSEAVLLVLLAAPCVVESAAALPKAVVEANAVIKAMQESTPLTAPTKKGLLAAKDPMKCSTDYYNLAMKKAYKDDYTACEAVSTTNVNAFTDNAVAGTSTPSCSTDPACTKFKKTCAAEAGWGFWVDESITLTYKDSTYYKASEHTLARLRCWPASCEGMEMSTIGGTETFELKAGTTGPTKSELFGSSEGLTATTTTIVEKMPAPMMFYIVIVVVVLFIALIVCLIKTGRCRCCGKCCPGGAGKEPAKETQMVEQK